MQIEIGGYFGLDLPDHGDRFAGACAFQSGRSAIEAVIRAANLLDLWIPSYVCDTVVAAAQRAGARVHFYALAPDLSPAALPAIPANGALLYVNYFGLCQHKVSRLEALLPPSQLIVDNCHALFAPHGSALASIYSPRKFAGLPDGGLVRFSPALDLTAPPEQDEDSLQRMRHLLLRPSEGARAGYADFDAARRSLNGVAPRRMSHLTARLLQSIDWAGLERRRRRNFTLMHARLRQQNAFAWEPDENDVALCYPLRVPGADVREIRERLAASDIFVPTFWPDAAPRLACDAWEAMLMKETLFLPMDQRLEERDVHRVCDRVQELLDLDGVPTR
jgi:hypothetical protein